jgi:hypothetical protein
MFIQDKAGMTKETCLPRDPETAQSSKSSPSENPSNCSFFTHHTFTNKRQYNKIRKQFTHHFKQEQSLHSTNQLVETKTWI